MRGTAAMGSTTDWISEPHTDLQVVEAHARVPNDSKSSQNTMGLVVRTCMRDALFSDACLTRERPVTDCQHVACAVPATAIKRMMIERFPQARREHARDEERRHHQRSRDLYTAHQPSGDRDRRNALLLLRCTNDQHAGFASAAFPFFQQQIQLVIGGIWGGHMSHTRAQARQRLSSIRPRSWGLNCSVENKCTRSSAPQDAKTSAIVGWKAAMVRALSLGVWCSETEAGIQQSADRSHASATLNERTNERTRRVLMHYWLLRNQEDMMLSEIRRERGSSLVLEGISVDRFMENGNDW